MIIKKLIYESFFDGFFSAGVLNRRPGISLLPFLRIYSRRSTIIEFVIIDHISAIKDFSIRKFFLMFVYA